MMMVLLVTTQNAATLALKKCTVFFVRNSAQGAVLKVSLFLVTL